jgi:hypothetical protein
LSFLNIGETNLGGGVFLGGSRWLLLVLVLVWELGLLIQVLFGFVGFVGFAGFVGVEVF